MLSSALRQASVRFSPSLTPSSRIGMPMAATKPFGDAHSGGAK